MKEIVQHTAEENSTRYANRFDNFKAHCCE